MPKYIPTLMTTPLVKMDDIDKKTLADHYFASFDITMKYLVGVLKQSRVHHSYPDAVWEDEAGVKHEKNGYLFHANSVRTAVDYIRRGYVIWILIH